MIGNTDFVTFNPCTDCSSQICPQILGPLALESQSTANIMWISVLIFYIWSTACWWGQCLFYWHHLSYPYMLYPVYNIDICMALMIYVNFWFTACWWGQCVCYRHHLSYSYVLYQVWILMGHCGAGKSTLLICIFLFPWLVIHWLEKLLEILQ